MDILKKERIRDRMLKTASKVWGIPENEIEANYDPLVLLILEACAAELEKVHYDIQASQNRLLDHLAELMLPDTTFGAQPPSCIMQAVPVSERTTVTDTTKFYCTQKTGNQTRSISTDVYFTPVGNFPILPVRLKNVLIGNTVFTIKENGTKEILLESNTDDSLPVSSIELAFLASPSLQNLEGLSLYFDLRSHTEASSFYKHLSSCKCTINHVPLSIKPGYALSEQFDLSPAAMLEESGNYTAKLNRHIAGAYQPQFLHLSDTQPISTWQSNTPPESWANVLPKEIAQKAFASPMIYLRLTLSKSFPRHVLESLLIAANVFPIVSRKFNTQNYRTSPWINIVPLQIDGAFLDLHDIQSSTGKYNYKVSPFKQDLAEGEATVRNTGVAKPNSREVRDMVNVLMQAIRDESAYFSDISNDTLMSRLREVNQVLIRLQDQLRQAKDLREQYSYVMLRPKNTGETLSIQYWTTNVKNARQIKAFTQLNSFEHTLVDPRTSYTLTPLVGGRETVSEEDKKNALRRHISSHGKIVSIEDIKLLAIQLYGEYLKNVTVNKTIQQGAGAQKGFARVIAVTIIPTEDAKNYHKDELLYITQEMNYLLSENATPVFTYQVALSL